MTVNPGEQVHLAPADLARRERVSLDTVYAWNRSGSGPKYMRVGKHARYRIEDVEEWERSRLVDREVGGDAA